MLSLPDRSAMDDALTLPLREGIKTLLRKRIDQIIDDGLDDLTHIVVLGLNRPGTVGGHLV